MALIRCYECGRAISTDAKACPLCGASGPKGKASKLSWIVGIAAIGVITYFVFEPSLNPTIPGCESFRGERVFKDMFEGSPYAQERKLRVLEVIDRKQIASGPRPEDTVCEITYSLTDTTTATYVYSFRRQKDGAGYIVRQEPK